MLNTVQARVRYLRNSLSTNLFSLEATLALGLSFTAVIAFLNPLLLKLGVIPDRPNWYWPVAVVFSHVLTPGSFIVAFLVLLAFYLIMKNFDRSPDAIGILILASVMLILGSNLIQGVELGLVNPIVGIGSSGMQYYADAIKIRNLFDFVAGFEVLHPTLSGHSLTHPPGPPLTVFILLELFREPALVSTAIAVISISLSLLFFHGLMATRVKPATASYLSLLYMLVPAIQIFYLATIDALIASFLLGVLYCFQHSNSYVRIFGTIAFLFLSSFMTFAFIFILPVLLAFEIARRRTYVNSLLIILGVVILYCLTYALSGFNYLNALRLASFPANPRPFLITVGLPHALLNWVQDVSEILVFFGPFLILLLIRGIRMAGINQSDLILLSKSAVLTLLALLLPLALFAGGRAGETARVAQFIYPYLLFPIGLYLDRVEMGFKERTQLGIAVLGQSVLMQLMASYYW